MNEWWAGMSRAARLGLVAGVLVVVVVMLSVVSRLSGSAGDPAAVPSSTPTLAPSGAPSHVPVATESPTAPRNPAAEPLPSLPDTRDPDEYASAVARVVLGLNPRDHAREDYLDLLFGEISDDVVVEDRKRLEPVIESWVPDGFQWQRQRDYAQVSSFTAESVWVPEFAKDNADDIPAGYQMRTVAGTQTTEFLDENNDVATSTTPRLVTVIAFCPAAPVGDCSLVSIPQEVQR